LDLDEPRNRAVRAELVKRDEADDLHFAVDDGLFHSRDLFWHASFVRQRAPLPPPPKQPALPLADDVIGIEENPLHGESFPAPTGDPPVAEPLPVKHAQLFTVLRRGFGREPLSVEITGIGERTVSPMLVNRDEGRGIGWVG